MFNDDPRAPWNSPIHDTPFAPWNGPERDNPGAPWNNPSGHDRSGGRFRKYDRDNW